MVSKKNVTIFLMMILSVQGVVVYSYNSCKTISIFLDVSEAMV